MTIQEITNELLAEGYSPYFQKIDFDVCQELGSEYKGFKREDSYRAFAVNPETQEAEEF